MSHPLIALVLGITLSLVGPGITSAASQGTQTARGRAAKKAHKKKAAKPRDKKPVEKKSAKNDRGFEL